MRFLSFLIVLFSATLARGQINLVPNPSFEDTVSCPTSVSGNYGDQIYKINSWFPALNSPDYFNSCAPTTSLVSTPTNGFGHHMPHSGNGYVGVITYGSPGDNYREIVGIELNSLLVIGVKYYLSFWISATYGTYFPFFTATNKMGVKFSSIHYEAQLNPILIQNDAFLFSDSIIADTAQWTKITFSFTADSSYRYLYIGNFYSDSLTDTIQYPANFGSSGAYYFLDDVCLSTDSLFCQNTQSMQDYDKNKLIVSPNPFNENIVVDCQMLESFNLFNELGINVSNTVFIQQENGKYLLDTAKLKSGMYYLMLFQKFNSYTFKLIKQ
jgi:hypothetical protein